MGILPLCVRQHCGTDNMAGIIDTAAKRAKLVSRKNPYWHGVSGGRGGLSLGYRKPANGPGTWVAKIVLDGQRAEERIGAADDELADASALSFPSAVTAALDWGRQQASIFEASRDADAEALVPTVRSSVEVYVATREARAGEITTAESLKQHICADPKFPDLRLARLSAKAILAWRDRLPTNFTASSRNRIVADVRAALNATATRHRRELPSHIAAEIFEGTRPEEDTGEPARKQLLTDPQILAVIDAAFEDDPDFGFLVLVAAATGGRFSQLKRLTVADVQIERGRIMMPGSRKGRRRRYRAPVAVPVDRAGIDRLRPILDGRQGGEVLLMRWAYARHNPHIRLGRRPWGKASEVRKPWRRTIKLAGLLPGMIMYALRHSSIVRGLSRMLPVRLVAALHDTSTQMIEKYYSAYIVDATEELARRTTLSLEAPPTATEPIELVSNVPLAIEARPAYALTGQPEASVEAWQLRFDPAAPLPAGISLEGNFREAAE